VTDPDGNYIPGYKFEDLLKQEKAAIGARTNRAGRTQWTGIALSGGGIRSAIFCLGAVQALAKHNVLGNFDYISSVSGGGYVASALQWVWHQNAQSGTSENNFPFGTSERPVDLDQAARLKYLRSHGQYLTPDERISIWSLTAVVIRTIFLNLVVWIPIGAFLLTVLVVLFRFLEGTAVSDWLPNIYGSLVGSRWKPDCVSDCLWPQEVFFGACTFAGLVIVLCFGVWAIAFSLDTRISPKQESTTGNWTRAKYAILGLLCLCSGVLAVLYFTVLRQMSTLDPILLAIAFLLAATVATCGVLFILQARAQDASANYRWRRQFEVKAGAWLPRITILFALGSVPAIPFLLINHGGPFLHVAVTAIGLVSGMVSAIVGHNAQRQQQLPSDSLRWVLMVTSALFIYSIALVSYLFMQLFFDPALMFGSATSSLRENTVRGIILGFIAIALVLAWRTNVNYVGLHRFYRDRLMEAFMPDDACVRANVVGRSPDADRLSIADLWPKRAAVGNGSDSAVSKRSLPYPIINTNAILMNDEDRKLAWRGGDSFVLSPLYVGCAATGWESTPRHVLKHGPLSLASAMAASGAALNANAAYVGAGVTRDRLISMVLMLLNIRLGIWVGRPSERQMGKFSREPNHINPAFRYGLTRAGYNRNSKFLELSDGGHFDNLGIYELVRRRLSLILVIDGEDDPSTAMPALYSVARRVQEDFGTVIDLDRKLDDLIPAPAAGYPEGAKFVKFPFFAAPIQYSTRETGVLIYVKLSLFSQVGFGARAYRAQNQTFPHQSTANQFFVPEQIDAYREVGYVNGSIAIQRLGLAAGTFNLQEIQRLYDDRNKKPRSEPAS
jgi:hypothetical protein